MHDYPFLRGQDPHPIDNTKPIQFCEEILYKIQENSTKNYLETLTKSGKEWIINRKNWH